MAGVLEVVNRRTQLVGENRLELLLFRLRGNQLYGINVFKVREVLNCPKLYRMPKSNHVIRGIAHIRGSSISIIDLRAAIGMDYIADPEKHLVIITEYNMNVQGFLVDSVDRIVNKNWEKVLPPPTGSGSASYLTAVTHVDGNLIEIIDVEKVIFEISPSNDNVDDEFVAQNRVVPSDTNKKILIVDDSAVARKQIERTVSKLGVECVLKRDGKEALDHIREIADSGINVNDVYYMVISDVEMPEMDGYTFTAEIKGDPRTRDLFILMHTSLSGVFNMTMVKKVGADDFLAKFRADELAQRVAGLLS